ncbi:MAG: DUF2155 domain-containing protein [Alphaproteobacteria bacterium]
MRHFSLLITALSFFLLSNGVDAREMTEYPRVKLQSLDKATARTMTFEAEVGTTLKFGPLYIKVQTCQKSSPIDEPESAAFLQIWEVDTDDKSEWVFSGWMFASSPGLSSMKHPIYDVWILDCLKDPNDQDDLTTDVTDADPVKDNDQPQDDMLEDLQ